MPERPRARALLPAVAAVVVSTLGGFAWWQWRVEVTAPPPTAPPGPTAAVMPAKDAVPAVGAAEAMAAARDAVPPCRVRGVALDGQGQPLAGWQVYCEQPRSRARRPARPTFGPGFRLDEPALPDFDSGTRSQTSDELGAFAFDGVAPGASTLWLADARGAAVELELAVGETRAIELRLPAERCAVRCLVRANGVACGWVEVRIVGVDGPEILARADGEGRVRALLSPGTYQLFAYGYTGRGEQGQRFVRGQAGLLVPAAAGAMEGALEIDETALTIVVEDETGAPIGDLAIAVTGQSRRGEELSFACESREAANVVHCDLVPGRWSVAVSSPNLQTLAPQSLTIDPGQPQAELRLVGRRGGWLRLVLRHVDGSSYRRALPVGAPLDYLAAVWNGTVLLRCLDPGDAYSATKLSLGGVPLGKGTLEWRDREVDGAHVFLPFEPVAATPILVQAGDRNQLVVVVEPRAFVELIGCESMGRELARGCVRVFAGAREVRSLPKERPARWRSFLPPGEYRVRIDHDGGTTERFVTVQRRDLNLRLRR